MSKQKRKLKKNQVALNNKIYDVNHPAYADIYEDKFATNEVYWDEDSQQWLTTSPTAYSTAPRWDKNLSKKQNEKIYQKWQERNDPDYVANAVRKGTGDFTKGVAQGTGTVLGYIGEVMNTPLALLGETLSGRGDYYSALPNLTRVMTDMGLEGQLRPEDQYWLPSNDQMTPGALVSDNPLVQMGVDIPLDILTGKGFKALTKTKNFKNLANTTGKFLTTQTPLKNTYKINPFALKENDVEFLYRWQADNVPNFGTAGPDSKYTGKWSTTDRHYIKEYLKSRPGSGYVSATAVPKGVATLPDDAAMFVGNKELREIERIIPDEYLSKGQKTYVKNNPFDTRASSSSLDDLIEGYKLSDQYIINPTPNWLTGYGLKALTKTPKYAKQLKNLKKAISTNTRKNASSITKEVLPTETIKDVENIPTSYNDSKLQKNYFKAYDESMIAKELELEKIQKELEDLKNTYRSEFEKTWGKNYDEKDLLSYAQIQEGINPSKKLILPKEFSEVNEQFTKDFNVKDIENISEMNALSDYTSGRYLGFNQLLGGQHNLPFYKEFMMPLLDDAITKNTLNKDLKLHRGFGNSKVKVLRNSNIIDEVPVKDLLPGDKFLDPKYQSTSLFEVPHFSQQKTILAPKGTNFGYANKQGLSYVPSELELTLPKNTIYEVTDPNTFKIIKSFKNGGMIKRKDGSYSQRGLWDNIRANKGSGKKPTKEMLAQEKKIKKKMAVGGVLNPTDPEDKEAAMLGMMKARMALDSHFGNPSAKRMTSLNPQEYTFTGNEYDYDWNQPIGVPAGETGTHFMTSMGNYAVPFIQQGTNGLYFNERPSSKDKEAMKFETPEEAQYFSENYKNIAPMMYNKKMAKGGKVKPNPVDPPNYKDRLQQFLSLSPEYKNMFTARSPLEYGLSTNRLDAGMYFDQMSNMPGLYGALNLNKKGFNLGAEKRIGLGENTTDLNAGFSNDKFNISGNLKRGTQGNEFGFSAGYNTPNLNIGASYSNAGGMPNVNANVGFNKNNFRGGLGYEYSSGNRLTGNVGYSNDVYDVGVSGMYSPTDSNINANLNYKLGTRKKQKTEPINIKSDKEPQEIKLINDDKVSSGEAAFPNMKNKKLPKMWGGGLTPILSDVASKALMNLSTYAVTDLIKTIREPEQEIRPTKPNTGFTMAYGGMIDPSMYMQQMMYGSYAQGGQVPQNIPVEVEGQEMYEMPNGQTGEFQGPSHENGGIPVALPEGTKVYSDRLKVNGKTMADRKDKRERNIAKLEKLLGKTPHDKFLRQSLERQKETAALEEQQDMAMQEQANQQQAQQEQAMMQEQAMAGLMQDPAMMQQMGMMAMGGYIHKLANGGEPVPPGYGKLYTGFGSYPDYFYKQQIVNHHKTGKPVSSWSYFNPKGTGTNWTEIPEGHAAIGQLDKGVVNNSKFYVGESTKVGELDSGQSKYITNTPDAAYTGYKFPQADLSIKAPVTEPEKVSTTVQTGTPYNPNKTINVPDEESTENSGAFRGINLGDYGFQKDKKRYMQQGTPIEEMDNLVKINGQWVENPYAPAPFDPYQTMNDLLFAAIQDPTKFGGKAEVKADGKKGNKFMNWLNNALDDTGDFFTGMFDGKGKPKKEKTKKGETKKDENLNYTRGDLMGMAGTLYGGVGPMMGTFMNRMMTPAEVNTYTQYGAEGLRAMQEAQGLAAINRDKQLGDIKLQEEAGRRRGRNSARGVNTLRALDIAADMGANQAQGQAYNAYAQQMMQLLGQKAQMENQQDATIMAGEERKRERELQNLDNFYTNLVENMTNQATLMQKQGKDMNTAKYNKDVLSLSRYYSKYGIATREGVNGLELYDPNTEKKLTPEQAQKIIEEQIKSETAPVVPSTTEKKEEVKPTTSTKKSTRTGLPMLDAFQQINDLQTALDKIKKFKFK